MKTFSQKKEENKKDTKVMAEAPRSTCVSRSRTNPVQSIPGHAWMLHPANLATRLATPRPQLRETDEDEEES